LLGDNAYNDGTQQDYDARFDPTLSPESAAWVENHVEYLGIGNHDLDTDGGQATSNNFSVPVPVEGVNSSAAPPASESPEHNYSFDYGDVHFVTFDSDSRLDPNRLDAILDWVEDDLAVTSAQWKIVFTHNPIAGTPDKDVDPEHNYYQQVLPRLRAAGVDILMVGDSHTYGWTYPLLGTDGSGNVTFVQDSDDNYDRVRGSSN
jgi:hypothetical protein